MEHIERTIKILKILILIFLYILLLGLLFSEPVFCVDFIVTDGIANINWEAPSDLTDIKSYHVFISFNQIDWILLAEIDGIVPKEVKYVYFKEQIIWIAIRTISNDGKYSNPLMGSVELKLNNIEAPGNLSVK